MATRRGLLLLVAVWAVGAVLATSVGLIAVRLVRDQVGDPATQPLSAAEVKRAVASASAVPRPTARPSRPTRTTGPARAPQRRTFSTAGGTVAVQCSGGRPSLIYAVPAAGWSVDKQESQPTGVEVRFRADKGDVRLRIGCSSTGQPVPMHD
ncbi:MAG: Septum formation initiator [Frankiales bacterium]|nr:Septum formation initiator [Frankiales bacterium]